jgi:hypothetical protein
MRNGARGWKVDETITEIPDEDKGTVISRDDPEPSRKDDPTYYTGPAGGD